MCRRRCAPRREGGHHRQGRGRADRSADRRLCHPDGVLRHRGRPRALRRRAGRDRVPPTATSPRMRSSTSASTIGRSTRWSIRSPRQPRRTGPASRRRLERGLLPRVSAWRPRECLCGRKRKSDITIRYPRNSITPIEGYAIVAEHLPDTGGYDVISNFQGPFSLHPVMARALRIPGAACAIAVRPIPAAVSGRSSRSSPMSSCCASPRGSRGGR